MKNSNCHERGYLILVVGNSGSGKDTIIKEMMKIETDLKLYSPKRYITRKPSEDEDNIYLTDEEFEKKSQNNEFALEWKIYNLKYGIPIEIDDWLNRGYIVIVNVSRTIIDEAMKKFRKCKVVFIHVPFEITLKRIKKRRRETKEDLEMRLKRAIENQMFHNADFIIDNSGSLETSINHFHSFLKSLREE